MPHNAAASSGSNQGPLHPALADALTARIAALKAADREQTAPIPVDLVTASGSGLDPHISPAAAAWQAPRVARARGLPRARVDALIAHVRKLRTEHEDRHAYWLRQPMPPDTREKLLVHAYRPAHQYFDLWEKEFVPAVLAGEHERAAAFAIKRLEPLYEEHRRAIDDVVRMAVSGGE